MIIDFAFLGETLLKLGAALPVTLGLFICSFMLGGVLALGVLALRMSRWPLASGFAKGYILIFRGSPLLIQLFLIYYGLGQFGVIRHSFLWPLLREPFICAVLALALCTAAYTAEILRGGLLAIPPGQIEAGRLRYVALAAAAADHCPGDAALCAASLLHGGHFVGQVDGAGKR